MMTRNQRIEKLWRKARDEGWDYARYCEEYKRIVRGETKCVAPS